MNKKILIVGLSTLLGFGLLGCQGGTASSSSEEASSAAEVSVPVVDGKYTVYFHLGATSTITALESYNSFFLNGAFNSWGTSTAAEFTALADTDIYYVEIDKTAFAVSDTDTTFDTAKRGYQLTVGWNSTSGAPTESQGTNYTYKADYNALYPGTSHPKMDVPVNDIVDLYGGTAVAADPDVPDTGSDEHWMVDTTTEVDYQTFASQPGAVKQLTNYSIKFKIADEDALGVAKPTWVTSFYATGSYDSWGGTLTDDYKLTADSDGYYIINFGDVYGGNKIEFMIVCTVTDAASVVVTTSFWTNKLQSDNLSWTPVAADGDDCVYTLDDPYQWAAWPSDPDAKVSVGLSVTVTDFTVSATADAIYVKGAWDGWASSTLLAETSGTWSTSIDMAKGTYEFGFFTALAGVQVSWFANAAGGNLSIAVTEAATFAYTGTVAAGVTLVTA